MFLISHSQKPLKKEQIQYAKLFIIEREHIREQQIPQTRLNDTTRIAITQ